MSYLAHRAAEVRPIAPRTADAIEANTVVAGRGERVREAMTEAELLTGYAVPVTAEEVA